MDLEVMIPISIVVIFVIKTKLAILILLSFIFMTDRCFCSVFCMCHIPCSSEKLFGFEVFHSFYIQTFFTFIGFV
uniref:Uncharacterized protein n=1 Tax=Panstrongylus lignarius TaxID=156445 RepID=A0A224Y5N1_9HEMI